jgi:hypothetical protein
VEFGRTLVAVSKIQELKQQHPWIFAMIFTSMPSIFTNAQGDVPEVDLFFISSRAAQSPCQEAQISNPRGENGYSRQDSVRNRIYFCLVTQWINRAGLEGRR